MASARMTKRGEGGGDSVGYDYCARKKATLQHCEWLRPRGLGGCTIQIPPVVKLRHSKAVVSTQVGWRALLLLWSLTPLLWLFAGQVQAVACWYLTDK